MDGASENGGRGRPQRFPYEVLDLAFAGKPGNPQSKRRQQDRMYALLALRRLAHVYGNDERLEWLVGNQPPKVGLLSELGRGLQSGFWGGQRFIDAVEWLLDRKPRVRDGEKVMRFLRIGRYSPEVPVGLRPMFCDLVRYLIDSREGQAEDVRSPARST